MKKAAPPVSKRKKNPEASILMKKAAPPVSKRKKNPEAVSPLLFRSAALSSRGQSVSASCVPTPQSVTVAAAPVYGDKCEFCKPYRK